jgi:hypothetical protein
MPGQNPGPPGCSSRSPGRRSPAETRAQMRHHMAPLRPRSDLWASDGLSCAVTPTSISSEEKNITAPTEFHVFTFILPPFHLRFVRPNPV